MADDREPPALFDDDVDTQETKTNEPEDTNPFNIGKTTEITLDDGTTNEEDSSTMNGEGPADMLEDETTDSTTEPLGTGGAASVDVTNLSKPSEDESELPSMEKPEVSAYLLKYFD